MSGALRILGIDPSVRSTGYGVIECNGAGVRLVEAGVIATNGRQTFSERLGDINNSVADIIRAMRPDVIAIEQVFARAVNPKTTIMMAHARGALLAAAALAHVEVVEFSATGVKRALAGSGAASKEQVGRMVAQLLHLSRVPRPADVTDALAIALACANRRGVGRRLR
ncbi:MAG: crossover junction endodeoxyribonuclease RuvC [Candidatus Eremiobacteraeota bacterium]|nr:crossover junction endodeoxyribonuclease RuvC [Candidatus Eremiobacteraeota bacterium]